MYLEVRDLRLLATLASATTLGSAALALDVSLSAVSHQLSSLERRCGGSLWRRGFGDRGCLTPLGAVVSARARRLLVALAEAEHAVSLAPPGVEGARRDRRRAAGDP